ncbi:signal peptide peptidase SppA [Ferrimonas lipolytica]|uniref:Signal peptide peptidase SppA n=1 Tax=Ferrimonas lipolytica TaxID=2724191 RepID=A0A6H1UE57_9GAMM|nr:signal peptide peptidase SppA [Ferrimonas lipolytica]QIZ76623.1 signal peptide peptidase SppA [Ferrimonas lipolytica]
MPKRPSLIGRFFRLIFSVINGFRRLVLNVLFFGILAAIIVSLGSDSQSPSLQNGAALVIPLNGIVVEELSEVDPVAALFGQNSEEPQEILLSELLHTIQQAGKDDRIGGIVLKPGNLGAGLSKLEDIGHALTEYKESGKPLLFIGGGIEQTNYYLASFADNITINSGGGVAIEGLGMSRLYYKEALDKLQITTHLYRVGKYKSFAESYTRNDMSDPAREASQAVIDDLWGSYVDTVSSNRDIDPRVLAPSLDNVSQLLEESDNDTAKMALSTGLVDQLATDIEMRAGLMQTFGADEDDEHQLNAIGYRDYASLVATSSNPLIEDKIAIVVAKGTILNGDQPPGTIGGVSTAKLLREARFDEQVKAVVLRVDSGGGSAYASEQLRQEVLALQAAGKPVVASMGSVAASGGYWISASADRIFAQEDTITGSIGIISMFQTFEKAAEFVGVHQDGVATSDIREISFIEPLNEKIGPIVQRLMDKGYHDFISLVSQSRGLDLATVDSVAQGRIWSGIDALELGLVDEIGSLDQAIAAAADLASIGSYDTKVISHELTPEQELIREILNSVSVYMPEPSTDTKLLWQLKGLLKPIEAQLRLNDPNNLYYLCVECDNIR